MALLEVLRFPDERLRNVAKKIDSVDNSIRSLVDDMFETMEQEQGIGLASIQVDVKKRVFITNVTAEQDQPLVFINPEITHKEGKVVSEEGCLSIPNNYAKVDRAEKVTVSALDRDGKPFTLEADGLLAICIQHELDHLNGVLFVDYLSPLKRQRIRKKLEKDARLNSRA
jgi:peptide deformylase